MKVTPIALLAFTSGLCGLSCSTMLLLVRGAMAHGSIPQRFLASSSHHLRGNTKVGTRAPYSTSGSLTLQNQAGDDDTMYVGDDGSRYVGDDDGNLGDDGNIGNDDGSGFIGDDSVNLGDDATSFLLADWEPCSTSEECENGCCSNAYSDQGQLLCTPLDGGFQADWCVRSSSNGDGGGDNGNGDGSDTPPTNPVGGSPGGGGGTGQYGLQADCGQDDSSRFNICLDLASSDGSYKSWMDRAIAARNRWEAVITGDTFSQVDSEELQGSDVATSLPSVVDDIYIAIYEADIDGGGNILGYGGPSILKTNSAGHVLPVSGPLSLDISDLDSVQADNTLQGLLEHELGHVFGFGTLFDSNGLHSGKENDSLYTGQAALQAWSDMGCSGDIPIETDGGDGRAGGHWDEECLVGELMTGYIGDGNYLSPLTIGAMSDLGYSVNMNAAESFTLDQLSSSQCGNFCPEASGAFSIASTTTKTTKSNKSAEAKERHAIMTVAAAMLQ